MTTCSKPKIKTVLRKKWHGDNHKWQVTSADGTHYSCKNIPTPMPYGGWKTSSEIYEDSLFYKGDIVRMPKNHRTTIRRIVDSKPKRKNREDD